MKKKIIIGAAAAAVLVTALILMLESDEGKIKKNLSKLEKAITKKGDEGLYSLLSKADKVASCFSEECSIQMKSPVRNINGRKKILENIGAAFKVLKKLTVSFHDISVTITGEKTAETLMTATARTEGHEGIEAKEIEMKWLKTDDGWLIDEVLEVETLR